MSTLIYIIHEDSVYFHLQMIAQLGKFLEFILNDFELGSKSGGFRSKWQSLMRVQFLKG